ncbi:MAG: hypothetical protein AB7L28_13145 [Kofleriaceae bacterium]
MWWLAVLAIASTSCKFSDPGDLPGGPGNDAAVAADAAVPPCETCQLLSVTPAIARPGQRITLEGTFGDHAAVRFPGGVVVQATIVGGHRATAVVPDAARQGRLTVDGIAGSVPFHAASFELALQGAGFQASYHQADGARTAPSFAVPRAGTGCVVAGRYVYAIGGHNGSASLGTVERALINADGTLGAFTALTEPALLQGRDNHATIVIGDRVYVIGGHRASNGLTSVEQSTIQPDGSLGPFAASSSLVQGRLGPMAVVIGSWLYVLGGQAATTGVELASIERAAIHVDGSLGPFALVTGRELVSPRAFGAALIAGRYLYAIAGGGNGSVKNTVERAEITGDGELGAFSLVEGVSLGTERRSFGSAVIGDSIYVLGGRSLGADLDSVERAVIDEDGGLGTFAQVPISLASPRQTRASLIIGSSLYLFGGHGTAALRTIERASINATGAIDAMVASSVSLDPVRRHASSHVIGDSVYLVGGMTPQDVGLDTVIRATMSGDGKLGPFTDAGRLTRPRSYPATAIVGRYLYVIGGNPGVPSDGSVERALIKPDGSLGTFTAVGSINLVEGRAAAAAVVSGNYLYVIGGIDRTSVERTAINADDSLAGFESVPVTLANPRWSATVVLTRNRVWLVGGFSAFGAATGNLDHAATSADGALTAFVTGGNVVAGRGGHASTVIGNVVYLFGGEPTGGDGLSSIERGGINADGTIGPFAVIAASLTEPRGGGARAVVADDAVHVLGGSVAATERAELD